MYLSLANHLATWARESATDDTSRVVFSSIMALTAGALTAINLAATIQSLDLAKKDIEKLVPVPSNPFRRVA